MGNTDIIWHQTLYYTYGNTNGIYLSVYSSVTGIAPLLLGTIHGVNYKLIYRRNVFINIFMWQWEMFTSQRVIHL